MYLSGRVSRFVNVAGRKVHPEDIERVIGSVSGVEEARSSASLTRPAASCWWPACAGAGRGCPADDIRWPARPVVRAQGAPSLRVCRRIAGGRPRQSGSRRRGGVRDATPKPTAPDAPPDSRREVECLQAVCLKLRSPRPPDVAWTACQAVNRRFPAQAFHPRWAPRPLLKSWERTAPALGWPRTTDSLCPTCVRETRARILCGERSTSTSLVDEHVGEIKAHDPRARRHVSSSRRPARCTARSPTRSPSTPRS